MKLYDSIQEELVSLTEREISAARKTELNSIASFLITNPGINNVIFICTHNSRRSQLAQAWATVISSYFNLKYQFYSGGTEQTKCHPSVVKALISSGLRSMNSDIQENHNLLKYGEPESCELSLFSKEYDHPSNPQKDFVAIMTCDHADENCPIVPGASGRFPLHYKDPKAFDGRPDEEQAYISCSNQIATELYFLISLLHEK